MKIPSVNRKTEILETAAILFKKRGYSAVTMRDLATALGIKAASLYNHIDSKQQILSEVVLCLARAFTSGIEEIIGTNQSNIEKLQAIIRQHVTLTSDYMYGMAALNNDWMHLEGDLTEYLELRSEYERQCSLILQNGKKEGELTYMNEEVVLFSILSTLRNLYLWIPKKSALEQEELVVALSETLLKGIVK